MRTKDGKIEIELTHIAAGEGTPKTSIHIPPHSKHTDRIVAAVLIVTKLNAIIKGILFIPSLVWISFRNMTHQIRIKPPKQQ
jgi:LEA14-like dessication related protein